MIETERLVLRPFTSSDATGFARMFADPEPRQYTRYNEDNTPAEIQAVFENHFLENPDTSFAIVLKSTQEIIGFFEFHEGGVMTYLLMKDQWRKGYMPEAGRAAIDYAFRTLGYDGIEGDYADVNGASGRVLEKMGLQPDGDLGTFDIPNGQRITVMVYRLTRQQWLESQH
ncbi:GNAT family N-acetyltransferase [Lacticaseibacillus pabuli]|uniref:GNAT family N-acetyltransferase n=1 Tax=Lacticaseibacillus pabuli TaxID=3025672 RepID=A0ABY7WSW0_9LACO|nr:GNAT family N-acetyltransferase [Lacticaseibacillus sp. KACC 23028]WDF83267.1 GNAT family N-acetyltransferase [Lacticaseibacillus sp. KACC 23028]